MARNEGLVPQLQTPHVITTQRSDYIYDGVFNIRIFNNQTLDVTVPRGLVGAELWFNDKLKLLVREGGGILGCSFVDLTKGKDLKSIHGYMCVLFPDRQAVLFEVKSGGAQKPTQVSIALRQILNIATLVCFNLRETTTVLENFFGVGVGVGRGRELSQELIPYLHRHRKNSNLVETDEGSWTFYRSLSKLLFPGFSSDKTLPDIDSDERLNIGKGGKTVNEKILLRLATESFIALVVARENTAAEGLNPQ